MKDAPIIILDEATANVDPENEKELVEAVDALTKRKNDHYDRTQTEDGTPCRSDRGRRERADCAERNHEQLMKQEGIYKRFVECKRAGSQLGNWHVKK
mgnify:CR=1 FL=1